MDMFFSLQFHSDSNDLPHATDDQIKAASAVVRRIDLKDFSVCQFSNPGKIAHWEISNMNVLGLNGYLIITYTNHNKGISK